MANNIGAYFEIPVIDMERAINFYQTLLGIELEPGSIHGYEMAFFPYEDNGVGISGALAKGDVYKPSIDGVFLYLEIDDIDLAISKAVELGSEVLLKFCLMLNCYICRMGSQGFVHDIAQMSTILPIEIDRFVQGFA